MKNYAILLMLLISIPATSQTIGRKLETKANETVDKVIDSVNLSDLFSKKKKKKKETKDPDRAGEKINESHTVSQEGITSSVEKSGKYVTYYQDVMMGDQKNTKYGPFFIPSLGQSVDVETADEMQKKVAMVLFSGYGGALILTFPANAKESDLSSSYDEIDMFKENEGGMGSWEQENINSGQLYKGSMSDAAFEKLAETNSWKAFNTAYSNAMDGMYSTYTNPNTGVYCIKFSTSLRALMRIKNVIPKSGKGGSIKFDIIIESKK